MRFLKNPARTYKAQCALTYTRELHGEGHVIAYLIRRPEMISLASENPVRSTRTGNVRIAPLLNVCNTDNQVDM
jgi:hypothetical protein